jgi:hypothetical protein
MYQKKTWPRMIIIELPKFSWIYFPILKFRERSINIEIKNWAVRRNREQFESVAAAATSSWCVGCVAWTNVIELQH